MEDFFKEQIIADIVKGAKTNDWRKVQEWFWDHERKINPTSRILVDGDEQVRQDTVRS